MPDDDQRFHDWQYEVANNITELGYQEWVDHKEDRQVIFDHHAGMRVDLPVGTTIKLPVYALDIVPRHFVRDDDGWRCTETDTYLHYDIEDFDFDVVELGESYCSTLGHDWRHDPVQHVTVCTKCYGVDTR